MPGIGGISIATNLLANAVSLNLNKNQALLQTAVTQALERSSDQLGRRRPFGTRDRYSPQRPIIGVRSGELQRPRCQQRGYGRGRRPADGNQHSAAHPRPCCRGRVGRYVGQRQVEPAGRSLAAVARGQPHLAEYQLQRSVSAQRCPRGLHAADQLQRDHLLERGSRSSRSRLARTTRWSTP